MNPFASRAVGFAALVVFLSGASGFAKTDWDENIPPSRRAPAVEWTLPTLDGTPLAFTHTAYKGKIVVLNEWATWCPSCREELGGFASVAKYYADRDIVFIGMTFDGITGRDGTVKGKLEDVAPMVKATGIAYPIVIPNNAVRRLLYDPKEGFPSTHFIDSEGRLAYRRTGSLSENQLRAILAGLIGERETAQRKAETGKDAPAEPAPPAATPPAEAAPTPAPTDPAPAAM